MTPLEGVLRKVLFLPGLIFLELEEAAEAAAVIVLVPGIVSSAVKKMGYDNCHRKIPSVVVVEESLE